MKFAIAGLLALVAVASSSAILPYSAWPYGSPYGAWPALHAAPITQYSSLPYAHLAAPISYAHHVAAPAHVHAYAAPAVHLPVHKLAATYTAATRGAVHTAPLEGHAVSQTSLNLAPAPGTW